MIKDVPIVGIVVTISPSFSLYRIVVFPAASRPTIKIRISFFPHSLSKSFENVRPMVAGVCGKVWGIDGLKILFLECINLVKAVSKIISYCQVQR